MKKWFEIALETRRPIEREACMWVYKTKKVKGEGDKRWDGPEESADDQAGEEEVPEDEAGD